MLLKRNSASPLAESEKPELVALAGVFPLKLRTRYAPAPSTVPGWNTYLRGELGSLLRLRSSKSKLLVEWLDPKPV